jgi:acyl-CoA thioester hydrolase
MNPRSTSSVRVRYAETDQMGVAWHGNYLAWFEVARTDFLRERGLAYRELEAGGLRLPVIEAQARYVRPARYDDVLQVHATLESVGRARVRFVYEVERDGEILATGATEHAAVDGEGRPRRLPDELRGRLR